MAQTTAGETVSVFGDGLSGGQSRAVPLQFAGRLDERRERAAVLPRRVSPVLPARIRTSWPGTRCIGGTRPVRTSCIWEQQAIAFDPAFIRAILVRWWSRRPWQRDRAEGRRPRSDRRVLRYEWRVGLLQPRRRQHLQDLCQGQEGGEAERGKSRDPKGVLGSGLGTLGHGGLVGQGGNGVDFYTSSNLLDWTFASRYQGSGRSSARHGADAHRRRLSWVLTPAVASTSSGPSTAQPSLPGTDAAKDQPDRHVCGRRLLRGTHLHEPARATGGLDGLAG